MAVALYARVSTTRQADNDLSIPDQLRQMREWCGSNGYGIAHEYVEPGASATDDRRPVFQEMIADATLTPSPYEAIVVHSQSRFFRDSIDFGLYERRLKKAGVKLISITQPSGDDAASFMIRRILSVYDEYFSKENGKHVIRAMKENARQGYFNGSRAPFGYRVVDADQAGSRGRKRKRLEPDPAEAGIVRRIFELYLHGLNGVSMGVKNIAQHLNERNLLMRGALWRIQKVHDLLADTVYIGEFVFNRRDPKNKGLKPESEWIRTTVTPIIDDALFHQVAAKRESRSPDKIAPRLVSSPVLLTGLLKCGCCGSGMTVATGKSGRYRYYKCTTKNAKSRTICKTRNLPLEKTDQLILGQLAQQVFTPERVRLMVDQLRERLRDAVTEEDRQLQLLNGELKLLEQRLSKLYEAVELGVLPIDSTLQDRAQKLKAERETVLTQMAGLRRRKTLPLDNVNSAKINAFAKALQARLRDPAVNFGKDYLRVLVDEIRVEGDTATVRGSYGALADAVAEMKMGTAKVPTFVPNWRIRQDSNPRPPGS